METIHSYRHIINSNLCKLFEVALRKAIKEIKLKNIGFIGLVLDYNKKKHHDLDILIFPSKNARIGEALIELEELYGRVEQIIKKKNPRYYVVTCAKKCMQELVYYIAGLEEGSAGLIPVHSLFFPDYKSFNMLNPVKFEEEIKKHLIPVYGDFNVIKEVRNDIPQRNLEPYFVILDFEMNARIKTFPKHNVRASAESLFDYLEKKYNIKKKKIPYNIKDIEKEFIELMRNLDKMTYSLN